MRFQKFLFKLIIFLAVFFISDLVISRVILGGLFKYYGFNRNADLLINGSSMAMTGFNRSYIEQETNLKTAFYAREGVNVEDRHVMLEHFFAEYPNSVTTVVYEINPLIFSGQQTAENVYALFFPFMDNEAIKSYIKKNASAIDFYSHLSIKSSRYNAQLVFTSLRGYLGKYDNYKTGIIEELELKALERKAGTAKVSASEAKIQVFERSMNLLQEKNTNVVLIMMPMLHEKKQMFDSSSYNQLVRYFSAFCEGRPKTKFVDFNTDSITTIPSLFSDPVHLNASGQKEMTERLISLLKRLDMSHKTLESETSDD